MNRIKFSPQVRGRVDIVPFLCGLSIIRSSPFFIKTELKDELTKELVTKDELKATEERLRGEIKATEEKLRTEIHKWRADTIKWMFIFWLGQIATFTGILISVLKLMLK